MERQVKRQYEGKVQLQSVGLKDGIKAKNLQVGDVMMWNFGSTSTVKEIRKSPSGKTIYIITEYVGYDGEVKEGEKKFRSETLVAVTEFAKVEEEVVEVEEVETVQEEKKTSKLFDLMNTPEYTELRKAYRVLVQGMEIKYPDIMNNEELRQKAIMEILNLLIMQDDKLRDTLATEIYYYHNPTGQPIQDQDAPQVQEDEIQEKRDEEEDAEKILEDQRSKALKKWERLKVSKYVDIDAVEEYESRFDAVWWATLREYDMFTEDQDFNCLCKRSAETTRKWLQETQPLTIEFKTVCIG